MTLTVILVRLRHQTLNSIDYDKRISRLATDFFSSDHDCAYDPFASAHGIPYAPCFAIGRTPLSDVQLCSRVVLMDIYRVSL